MICFCQVNQSLGLKLVEVHWKLLRIDGILWNCLRFVTVSPRFTANLNDPLGFFNPIIIEELEWPEVNNPVRLKLIERGPTVNRKRMI